MEDIFIEEVRGQISDADWARVHFLGDVRSPFHPALAAVDGGRPTDLSVCAELELAEAMSVGCAIVASDTCRCMKRSGATRPAAWPGLFDAPALAREVSRLLDAPARAPTPERKRLESARANLRPENRCVCRVSWIGSPRWPAA